MSKDTCPLCGESVPRLNKHLEADHDGDDLGAGR